MWTSQKMYHNFYTLIFFTLILPFFCLSTCLRRHILELQKSFNIKLFWNPTQNYYWVILDLISLCSMISTFHWLSFFKYTHIYICYKCYLNKNLITSNLIPSLNIFDLAISHLSHNIARFSWSIALVFFPSKSKYEMLGLVHMHNSKYHVFKILINKLVSVNT